MELDSLLWLIGGLGGGGAIHAAAIKLLPWAAGRYVDSMRADMEKIENAIERLAEKMDAGFEKINGRVRAAERQIAVLEARKPSR